VKTVMMIHKGGLGGIRGSEQCFIESANALVQAGFKIIFCRNLPVMDEMLVGKVAAIEHLQFPEVMLDGLSSRFPLFDYFQEFKRLFRLVRYLKPAVIYVNGGLPCQLAVPIGKLLNVPVVSHFHHPACKRYYYIWLVKFADRCFSPSQFTANHLYKQAGVKSDVVYCGVNSAIYHPIVRRNFQLRERLKIPSDAVVVGQVGALERNKRPDMLLRAFAPAAAKIKSLHLCFIGKGSLAEELREQVHALGLDERVTLTGFVEETLPYYQEIIDINALVSAEEGLGISIIEGSACGLAALVSDCSGLRETVVPGATGVAFPADDDRELTRLLIYLAENKDVRDRMGTAGRQLVEQKFSLATYHAAVVNIVASSLRAK